MFRTARTSEKTYLRKILTESQRERILRLYESRVPQRESDNKESGYRGYINQGCHRGRTRTTIKRADKEATLIESTAEVGEG